MSSTIVRHAFAGATLVVPSAWRKIDLGRTPRDEAARLLGAWSAPPDGITAGFLADAVAAAGRAGVAFAAVLSGDGDVPVSGSLVCAALSAEPWSVASLELGWRAAGRPCETVGLAVGPAVRTVGQADLAGEPGGWEMQLAVPHLDEGGLLMVFSTPIAEVAGAFEVLAMAIASTLRWKERHR